MRRKLEKEEGVGEGKRGQRSKLNVPQGSVWGHGAAFLPRVKGHFSRGIINKLGMDREGEVENTFTLGSILQTNKRTHATVLHYTGLPLANYYRPSHLDTHTTDRLEWRGTAERETGLSWVVVSCHDAELCSGPE